MSKTGQPRKHKTHGPELTAQDVRFCQALFAGATQHDAYVAAGYPAKATRRAAEEAAFRRVKKREIRDYLRDLQDAAADAAKVSVETLARGFSRAERADLRRLMGPDGEMLPPGQWPDDVALCITSLEVEELTEMQPDPDDPRRKKKVAVGTKWKVRLENKTECRKVLAQWRRMIGNDAEPPRGDRKNSTVIEVELGPESVPAPPPPGA